MKLKLSKKLIALLIGGAVVLLIIIGALASGGGQKETYVTDTVKQGDLAQTVDVTGEIAPLKEVDLSFAESGIIETLYSAVGDLVASGDLLAALRSGDLSAEVSRARAELALQAAPAREEDVTVAEANVTVAEASLRAAEADKEAAEQNVTLTAEVNSAALESAEAELAQAKENGAKNVADTADNLHTTLGESVAAVRAALSKADEILGVENTLFGNDFERELSAQDPTLLIRARETFVITADDRDLAEASVYANGSTAYADTYRALTETDETLLYTRQALDATSADSSTLSLDDLVAYKASVDAARTNVQAEIAALSAAKKNADNAVKDADQAETNAELALKKLEASTAKDTATVKANLASAESAVLSRNADLLSAKANLEKVRAGARAVDLAPLQAALRSAEARLMNAEIFAPFAGRLTAVKHDEGEAVNFGETIITIEPLATVYAITVDIPESDVAKIALNDKAEITLDAFGEDTVFTGTLVSLDQSEKLIEGVVFYEATVVLDDSQETDELKSGMSADITIKTDNRTNVLYVPTRSVLENDNGEKYVRVMNGETYEERIVTVGLRADEGLTEIVSGLKKDDLIVVSIKK